MKNYFFSKYQFFLFTISIIFFFYLLGHHYINFNNYDWLNSGGDISTSQIGWKFFKNDLWRFPLGLNPNYGIELGNSIVFTDSIPLFAITFKIFKNFLPDNFQYFSFWIFFSIYLQLLIAFLIIFEKTKNVYFSIIGSIFFIIAPIFIFRSGLHLSLMGQWIILVAFYIEILDTKYKSILRSICIVFSCTVHLYFTIILSIIYFIIQLFIFFEKKNSFLQILKETLITYTALIIIMFIVGYFSVRIEDGLGAGYGSYNLNLNSFFNPVATNYVHSFNWSSFLPEGKLLAGGEYEGFSYLGLGGFFFLILFIINFTNFKYKTIFSINKTLSIFIIFFILALSHNVNFGDQNLISFNLNKYLMILLSTIRASGRLIWPIYYLILFSGILIIYKKFKKNSTKLIVISMILLIQLIDLAPGLKNHSFGVQYEGNKKFKNYTNNIFWKKLSHKINIIKAIEIKNHSYLYYHTAGLFLKYNFEKTDIIYLARVNRKKISEIKYSLYNAIFDGNKDIFKNTAFLTLSDSVVNHLHSIYGDDLHYYFRNNMWIVTDEFIEKYSDFEKNKNYLYANNLNYGLGWIKAKDGLWSDGYRSSILVNLKENNCSKNLKLIFSLEAFNKKSDDYFEILLNKKSLGKYKINNLGKVTVPVKFYCNISNLQTIDLIYKNPISLRDLKIGLNESKRFLKLINFEIAR